jgi:hypothetical protein
MITWVYISAASYSSFTTKQKFKLINFTSFLQMAMSAQVEINSSSRRVLLTWLAAVNRNQNYSIETWCIAVRYK